MAQTVSSPASSASPVTGSGPALGAPAPASTIGCTTVRYRVLFMLFMLMVITYLDRLCISAAAPSVSGEFRLSTAKMGYVFSAFTLAYSLFEVPSGWLGDYIGTRKALARIVVWWSAFTSLTGATRGFGSLLVVRFLFGVGEAGCCPTAARTVSRWFPLPQQGRALSTTFIGQAVGAAITTPLVFFMIRHQGWRLAFVEIGAVGLIWCAVWVVWFRDTPEEHRSVNQAEIAVIRSDNVSGEGFGRTRYIPWRQVITSPTLLYICAMYFGYGYALYFYITWLPTYLLKARGFSTAYAGWFSSLPWIFSIPGYAIGGWATDRLCRAGRLKLARCGVGAFGLGASMVMLLIVAQTPNRVLAATLIALALSSQLFTAGASWAVCMDIGRRSAGVITGFMNTVGNFAGAIASVVLGYIVERTGSWSAPFYITAGLLAISVMMWLVVDPRRPVLED